MLEQSANSPFKGPKGRLILKASGAFLCRLLLNTARRFVYPFAPALSRGLGVPLTAITSLIAVNQATGILAVVFGPLADRLGFRTVMLLGLFMMSAGMLLGGLFPYYLVVMAALFFAGLGKSMFDPAFQAYIGEMIPYKRRGMVIGFFEMSWAGSTLVGIPLIALVMDRLNWQAPFFIIGGMGLLCFVGFYSMTSSQKKGEKRPVRAGLLKNLGKLAKERRALGALGFMFFLSAGNDNLFVIYGAWLEKSFGLSPLALGLGVSVIGAAELFGEFISASLSDRVGLKRSILAGLVFTIAGYLLLPVLEGSYSGAMAGLFIIFITYEFTIVTFFSLCTELLPEARATMMSGCHAAAGAGRVLGALSGGFVWLAGGINAVGISSGLLSLLALFSLVWGLKKIKA